MTDSNRGKPLPVNSSKIWGRILDLILFPLILLTSFVSYVRNGDYNLFAAEVLLPCVGLALVGVILGLCVRKSRFAMALATALLVTIFVDFQFDVLEWWGKRVAATFLGTFLVAWFLRHNLSRLFGTVFGVLLVSTAVLGGAGFSSEPWATAASLPKRADLPVILHIVLDGHIGIEGIPTDVEAGPETKAQLKAFYSRHGFLVFGKAYSNFQKTRHSIGGMMNFSPEPSTTTVRAESSQIHVWELRRNEYFARLSAMGYRIDVSETDYMSFCREPRAAIVKCDAVPSGTGTRFLIGVRESALPVADKIRFIVESYTRTSFFYGELKSFYEGLVVSAAQSGRRLPPWGLRRVAVSIFAIKQFDRLAANLATAKPGEVYFAHILIPHAPYRRTEDCALRPVSQWLASYDTLGGAVLNTDESWRVRYVLYLEQVRCTVRQLDRVFSALKTSGQFDKSIVIVHGDHGSRIALTSPNAGYADLLTDRDYVNIFSALFAIKAPGLPQGYDLELRSVGSIFADFVIGGFSDPRRNGTRREPTVTLLNGGKIPESGVVMRRPMPDFGSDR